MLVQHSRHDGLLHVLEVTVRGGCGLVQGLVGKQQTFPAGAADMAQNLGGRKESSREHTQVTGDHIQAGRQQPVGTMTVQ